MSTEEKKKPAPSKPKAGKKRVSKKKVARKKAAVKKRTAAKKLSQKPQVSHRERYEMIATMAYYRAEARNFTPGKEQQDWLECEQIVDSMLHAK
ncbi:MAG: DUF2934 domain-containing protein [Gammaproteobacteria bacterium]|nr:DUF2934 domain-containing protein [Gammaproteobacteria bacterium]